MFKYVTREMLQWLQILQDGYMIEIFNFGVWYAITW